jgi:hypothetical protein
MPIFNVGKLCFRGEGRALIDLLSPNDLFSCRVNGTHISFLKANLLPEVPEALTVEDRETAEYGVWQVDAEPVKRDLISLAITADPHSQLTMTLVLERKPLFYIYNVIYPAIVIMAISLLGLCLPNNSGKKMIFCVSFMVAINFFQQFLLKVSFPTGEGIPLLGEHLTPVFLARSLSNTVSIRTPRRICNSLCRCGAVHEMCTT